MCKADRCGEETAEWDAEVFPTQLPILNLVVLKKEGESEIVAGFRLEAKVKSTDVSREVRIELMFLHADRRQLWWHPAPLEGFPAYAAGRRPRGKPRNF